LRSALIAVLFVSCVLAEPYPWGIAVDGGGNCAAYWGGDEFAYYPLPEGWIPHYPTGTGINVDEKSCNFVQGQEEECCRQLGLTYVDLPTEREMTDWGFFSAFSPLASLFSLLVLALLLTGIIVCKRKTGRYMPFNSIRINAIVLGLVLALSGWLSVLSGWGFTGGRTVIGALTELVAYPVFIIFEPVEADYRTAILLLLVISAYYSVLSLIISVFLQKVTQSA
jgi:hypothetical protein